MRRSSGLSGWFSPQHGGCFNSDSELQELQLSSLLPLDAFCPDRTDVRTVNAASPLSSRSLYGNRFVFELSGLHVSPLASANSMLDQGLAN
jgi:hypothetical protein